MAACLVAATPLAPTAAPATHAKAFRQGCHAASFQVGQWTRRGLSQTETSPGHGRIVPSLSGHKLFATGPSLRRNSQLSRLQAAQKWVLEPAGDGDSSHLDEETPEPSEVELDKDIIVIGRSPEKSDIVLPVATVSGRHAMIEKRGGEIFVTDLESTNGTYLNDRQLAPKKATAVSANEILTFGDEHLAQFRLVERSEE